MASLDFKLFKEINQLGWFGKELKMNITIKRAFEGYSGHATETWETQYEVTTEGIKNTDGKYILIPINEKSRPYESISDFLTRIENQYYKQTEPK